MWSFVISHLSYCAIVWMFHSQQLNYSINNIHERALQIIYQDYTTCFNYLLANSSLTIHHRHLQKLVMEIFKVKASIAVEIMKDIFQIEDKPYKIYNYGTYMASFIGPRIWDRIPQV